MIDKELSGSREAESYPDIEKLVDPN